MKKHLIICADDFGLTQGINRAIVRCYNAGRITLSTVIPNSLFFEEAVALAREYGIPCGVHLTMATEFDIRPLRPLLKNTPTNEEGILFPNVFPYLNGVDEKIIYNEFRAQILKVKKAGISPVHIDSHMHVFSMPILRRLSEEFSLPCRDFIELHPMPDETHFHLTTSGQTEEEKKHAIVEFVSGLKKRVNVIICHPTEGLDEMRENISDRFHERYNWMTVLRFQDISCLLSDSFGIALKNMDAILSTSFI